MIAPRDQYSTPKGVGFPCLPRAINIELLRSSRDLGIFELQKILGCVATFFMNISRPFFMDNCRNIFPRTSVAPLFIETSVATFFTGHLETGH